jgi:hypothetical protein
MLVTLKVTGQRGLHQTSQCLGFIRMIARFASCAVLFLATTFLISACASRDEAVTDESASQSAATVPGEKMSDDGSYAPGPPGSSGSVRW